MSKSVFGLSDNESQAEKIVQRAQRVRAFPITISRSCSLTNLGRRDFAHEQHTKAPEGAATGAGTGGVLGGALGWLIGIGSLAIPGVGPFIAAGPIMAALAGAGVGAAVGGLTGALVGMGIPEYEAKRYEGKIKEGNILISVHSENSDEVKRAQRIFLNVTARTTSLRQEKKAFPSGKKGALSCACHGQRGSQLF